MVLHKDIIGKALRHNDRVIREYVVTETFNVPAYGKSEEGKHSSVKTWREGMEVFCRWDASWPNLIEAEYPGGRNGASIIYSFTIDQWKKVKPKLKLIG